jgi:hypothetical protein
MLSRGVRQPPLCCPHCVVVWVAVLWGTTTCIPCTHGRTFCSLSLKWNLIAQPGTSVMFNPPPPIRRPNLAEFAKLVCRIVRYLRH